MGIRIYKQVIEFGHTEPEWESYWGKWVVDSVIEEAEKVTEYLLEAKKKTTYFGGGIYHSQKLGDFSIKYYPLGEWKDVGT